MGVSGIEPGTSGSCVTVEAPVAELVKCRATDLADPGSSLARVEDLSNRKRVFIAHSFSLLSARLESNALPTALKGRATLQVGVLFRTGLPLNTDIP